MHSSSSLRWETRNAHKALKLRQWADESAERKLKNTFITSLPLPECIPYPHHLTPREFQFTSAWWCLGRDTSYLADQQGLGKTITAVLCMNAVPGRTLIICPPFLKYNWFEEFHKWSTWFDGKALGHVPMVTLVESGDVERSALGADTVILPDSLIDNPAIQHYLKDTKFTWLFIDEAHRFKTPDSNRTVALIGSDKDEKDYFQYTNAAARVCYMSGTPTPNGRPIEMYPVLSRTAPEAISWRTAQEFGEEFCDGKLISRREGKRLVSNWDFTGASNHKRLRRELRAKFMIRHLKKDVLDELPAKQRKLIFLDAPKEVLKLERKLLKNQTLDELLGDFKGFSKNRLGQIATYQKELSQQKLPLALAFIRDWLENNDGKLVVFAHHIEMVESLAAGLKDFGAIKIRGGMDAKAKHKLAKKFQKSPKHRVTVGNMDAMGVGLTLTAASLGIVVEPSWVSGNNEQAEDRLHRMTQEASVYMYYLVLRGTLDERKLCSVLLKEANISKVMGNGP